MKALHVILILGLSGSAPVATALKNQANRRFYSFTFHSDSFSAPTSSPYSDSDGRRGKVTSKTSKPFPHARAADCRSGHRNHHDHCMFHLLLLFLLPQLPHGPVTPAQTRSLPAESASCGDSLITTTVHAAGSSLCSTQPAASHANANVPSRPSERDLLEAQPKL